MQFVSRAFSESPGFSDIADAARLTKSMLVYGVCEEAKPFFAAALSKELSKKPIFVVSDERHAYDLSKVLFHIYNDEPLLFFGRDFVFHNIENISRRREGQRLSSLFAFLSGNFSSAVITADTLVQRIIPPEKLKSLTSEIKKDIPFPLTRLIHVLSENGYERAELTEGYGQFSVRGGIVDFFPTQSVYPVRIEFFGDIPDLLGEFDPATQRKIKSLSSVTITPALEVLLGELEREKLNDFILKKEQHFKEKGNKKALEVLSRDISRIKTTARFPAADKYLPVIYDRFCSVFDYIGKDSIFFLANTPRIKEALTGFVWRTGEDIAALAKESIPVADGDFTLTPSHAYEILGKRGAVMAEAFSRGEKDIPPSFLFDFPVRQTVGYRKYFDGLSEEVKNSLSKNHAVAVMVKSAENVQFVAEALEKEGIKAQASDKVLKALPKGGVFVMPGGGFEGFESDLAGISVFTFGKEDAAKPRKPKYKSKKGEKIKGFSDINPGDYVVHDGYGIGIYQGTQKVEVEGIIREFIKIRYAGTDTLYIPVEQLDIISKYVGAAEGVSHKLNRLGGGEWQRQKQKVKKAVADLAKELIHIYAKRSAVKGFAFSKDNEWQKEFEEKFEYAETEDQLRTTEEIKHDMESSLPMDRLLCGDVGFGKTEVALRAIFKCVLDGKQAALLVPTTILALQHYKTIVRRMDGYPVKIEFLSRFKTPQEQKKIISDLKKGSIDILVGTHRLIQTDVIFKDLGLLIIDEEQRFGVMHKERLKEITEAVDVLSLSATPIPRTLNMALSGIKDMSVIEEPPADRHPVITYVLEHDMSVIADAVRREWARGGQVYYLSNRIDSLNKTAARLSEHCPGIRIATAHGKMGEKELSEVWEGLINGEVDVLVCTTIIETGVDVPNVNTLIVENADRLGLSQLHQIRGRVGRSSKRAYAYFTYRTGKVLTEEAYKRLSAIREFTEFGSGLKIALRDLEIRGAGNILGAQQHGHIASVGYDMYIKLLDEAVRQEKGEKAKPEPCVMDLTLTAYIPDEYIDSGLLRIEMYKRVAAIENDADAEDVLDELIDRFGDPPKEVTALVDTAKAKALAGMCGIAEIVHKKEMIMIFPVKIDMPVISALSAAYPGRIMFSASSRPYLSFKPVKDKKILSELMGFLTEYRRFISV